MNTKSENNMATNTAIEDKDEEHEEEPEDEEPPSCYECDRYLDEFEVEEYGDLCHECDKKVKLRAIQRNLPDSYIVHEVKAGHRKACCGCGKRQWDIGEYYVNDPSDPWGIKYCLDCAMRQSWYGPSDEEEYYSDEGEDEVEISVGNESTYHHALKYVFDS